MIPYQPPGISGCHSFQTILCGHSLVVPGAYEPPKAAKEHAITMYTWVPSKYKFKPARFPHKGSAHLLVVSVI